MPSKIRNICVEIICLLFVVLFGYAASSKLVDYEKFRVQLGQSPLLTSMAGMVAWLIPAIELLIVLLLSFSPSRLEGLYASFTLMVVFAAYIIAIAHFSEYIPCSCGGILQQMNWNQHLLFNLVFIGLGGFAVLLYQNELHHPNKLLHRDKRAKPNPRIKK